MNIMKHRRSLRGLVWAAVACALPFVSCDELLDVTDPDRVNPETLDDPATIDVVVTGAYGDFTVAYSGNGGDAFLSTTSLLTDEFFSTGTFSTRTATDRRIQQTPANGNTSDGGYNNMQQARRALMIAVQKLADHPDKGTSHPEYLELSALHGYTYLALGEAFCSYVPISNDEETDPQDGPPRTSTELFEAALPIFDGAGGGDLASIGRARALMNLGRYSEAAAAVAGVPTDWNYFLEHSDNAARNPFYSLQSNGRYSISHMEGGNQTGLSFRGATDGLDPANADPRIPWFEDPAGGFDPQFRLFVSEKYPAFTSPVVLASGIEARLIEAEALLASGGDWIGTLNALRADVENLMVAQIDDYSVANPVLADLTDPGSADARVDLLFAERAMWLWGTGHRVGDLRRLINQYGRAEAQVYPSGDYHKGGSHGADVVFPVDFDEGNIKAVDFDIDLCVVTSATFN